MSSPATVTDAEPRHGAETAQHGSGLGCCCPPLAPPSPARTERPGSAERSTAHLSRFAAPRLPALPCSLQVAPSLSLAPLLAFSLARTLPQISAANPFFRFLLLVGKDVSTVAARDRCRPARITASTSLSDSPAAAAEQQMAQQSILQHLRMHAGDGGSSDSETPEEGRERKQER